MEEKDIYSELSAIRSLIEHSSKFISLSGLSGIMAGIYGLIGAWFAIRMVSNHEDLGFPADNLQVITRALIVIGLIVMVLSAVTAYWLTVRQAKKRNENVWNPVSRRLLAASGVPFLTGGLFIAALILRDEYSFIPPACLIFYGLALVAGGQFTFSEVKWLGFCQIVLGLAALVLPRYGLVLWAIGFGVLHIVYGAVMYFKYER